MILDELMLDLQISRKLKSYAQDPQQPEDPEPPDPGDTLPPPS